MVYKRLSVNLAEPRIDSNKELEASFLSDLGV